MHLMKSPGGNLATSNGNTIGSNDNKKYVIHQEMRMLSNSATPIPTVLFRGVIKIPKLYQRNGSNDAWALVLFAPGVDIEYCVQCIYKEYQ